MQDIISVELSLTQEYITIQLVAVILCSLILGILSVCSRKYKLRKPYQIVLISVMCISYIAAIYLDSKQYQLYLHRTVPQNYVPFSIFYNTDLYLRKYHVFNQKSANKLDLTEKYSFKHQHESQTEPKIVVLVIGESMRGDLLYLNGFSEYLNTPKLSQRKNLKNFKNATSSANSTRVSIPYMLTSASSGEWEKAMSEKSIISIFKSLGFKTIWIGAQGAFNKLDYTFGPMIMEADKIITKSEIRKDFGKSNVYDEYLLLYLDKFLKQYKDDNLFIVIHMIGSHWHFNARYPEKFQKFHPVCDSSSPPASCTREQILSSYHNTIYYSDYVLDEIINRFIHKDAFLFFASDHGYSLFEDEFFGNAYEGERYLKGQYDIGMFFWASDKYIARHSDLFNNVMNHRDKISHDYLFHSLLGCTQITSELIDDKLNLCAKSHR